MINNIKILVKYMGIALFLVLTFISPVNGEYLDLSQFQVVNGGFWNLSNDNLSVTQIDGQNNALFYLTDYEIINKEIRGTIRVDNTTFDNDEFGLAFGFKDINNTYIWSWSDGGVHGTEGQVLYYKNEEMNYLNIPGDILYDGRTINNGWEKEKDYDFKVIYLENSFKLIINDQEIINVKGEFNKGKFGFFCYSQDKVEFSNISITSADYLLPTPLDELNNPVKISDISRDTINGIFDLVKKRYEITNSVDQKIDNILIKVNFAPVFKMMNESLTINKDNYTFYYDSVNNELQIKGLTLNPKETIRLTYYIKNKPEIIIENKEYINKLNVYSQSLNIKLSKTIVDKINFFDHHGIFSSEIIGSVMIKQGDGLINKTFKNKRPIIITSDGKIIEVDEMGRYHIGINNSKLFDSNYKITLNLILPIEYNGYRVVNKDKKMVKIKPGELLIKNFIIESRD